ncbi:MAG TPA: DUF6636 domain-containing protein [Longimicrobium sp.]|nr:DUF6636 domain-containing protein [Longimicrobium sp.]
MKIIRFSALAVAAAATLALRPAPRQDTLYSFQTPTGNIGCMAVNDGGWSLRCDIGQKDWNGGSAGRDCDLDQGDALGLRTGGRTYWVCHGDTVLRQGAVLGYGSTWRAGPFTCTSARTGVTCRNRAAHGFTLSRASYRIF